MYYLLTFSTTTDAMTAESLLTEQQAVIVSVPSEITAGCGFAVRLMELESAIEILRSHVAYTDIYRVSGRGREKVITHLP